MPQTENTRKHRFTGSLARRVLLVCLTLLVIPLFLHSFFLYRREILIEEQEIVEFLQAFTVELGAELEQKIQYEWKVLSLETPELAKAFQIEKIPLPLGAPKRFAVVDAKREALLVGIETTPGMAYAIAHPVKELLSLRKTPFPIDIAFAPHPPNDDEWVESIPIAETKLVLTLGTSRNRIAELEQSQIAVRIGSFVLLLGVIGGGLVWLLTRKLASSLNSLCQTMDRVSGGASSARFSPKPLGFEINNIGLLFNDTLDALLSQQKAAEKEKLHREKLAQELKLGHDIQASLLPGQLLFVQGPQITTGCVPATEVGGDFCDAFPLLSGELLLVMADVAGKGISACLFSLGLRSSLRALAASAENLSSVVAKANDLFLMDAKETGLFATLWLGIVRDGVLEYINLGHPPALLKRKGQLQELTTHHVAMGLMPLHGLKSGKVSLEAGDELLLYSDGITEAHNAKSKLYGIDRLKKTFLRDEVGQSTGAIVEKIFDEALAFSDGAPQHDDMTLLLARW
jgi:serine phosphatase RsbU (regulator of sigma subunit)